MTGLIRSGEDIRAALALPGLDALMSSPEPSTAGSTPLHPGRHPQISALGPHTHQGGDTTTIRGPATEEIYSEGLIVPQLSDPLESLVFSLTGILRSARLVAEADGRVTATEQRHLEEIDTARATVVTIAAKRKAMAHFERMEMPTDYTAQLFAMAGFAIAPLEVDPQITTTHVPALPGAR